MIMHCQFSTTWSELLMLVAAIILPALVLIPYCFLLVTAKGSDATTQRQKRCQKCHSFKKAGRRSWKSRRLPPKRVFKKKSSHRGSTVHVNANNFLWQCTDCNLSQHKYENAVVKPEPVHNDSHSSQTHNQSLAETMDQTRPVNKNLKTLYDLYHTVYSKVLEEDDPNPQERTFYILVHSKHDRAAREAKRTLNERNIVINMEKQILSMKLPNRFRAALLCNDLISDPPQIDLDLENHREKVLKVFTVSMKKPDEMEEILQQVRIEYKVSTSDTDETRSFCFPWFSKRPSVSSDDSQLDKYVYNAYGDKSIAFQCNNTYNCCPQHCPSSSVYDSADENDHQQIREPTVTPAAFTSDAIANPATSAAIATSLSTLPTSDNAQ